MWYKWIGFLGFLCAFSAAAETLDSVVAVVNDGVVTQRELDEHLVQLREQLRAKQAPIPPEEALKKQVLNHLIDETLQLQIAQHSGVEVDMAEVEETISNIAEKNHLAVTDFRKALEKEGMAFDVYRDLLRKEMVLARIQQQAVGHDIVISNEQIEDYLKTATAAEKATYRFHVQAILVALPDEPTPEALQAGEKKARILLKKIKAGQAFEDAANVEAAGGEYPAEFNDLGQRHLAELPDVFRKRVIQMKIGEVAGPVRTDNGYQLIKLIAVERPDKHHVVLKTHVRHILIKQDASTTEDAAELRIQNLYEQLKSGKSFAELAKQYSQDTASGEQGGDLGWVTSGELVPAFAEVMDKLPLNKVSQPIKTGFGWHLIEVLARKEVDDSEAFERQQVRQFLHQRKFAEAIENWQRHLRSTSYINILNEELA